MIRLGTIAWLAAIVPLIAGNTAYLISASADLVPWCFPYLDGCTSISRAARHGTANLVYRGMLLPYSVLMVVYWLRIATWVRHLAPAQRRTAQALGVLGTVASIFMALYLAFLGVDGEIYQWMRRYGITVYFATTVLAEILLTRVLAADRRIPANLRRSLVVLCAVLVGLGVASIPLQHLAADRDAAVNAIEWTYSLLMLAFFPLTGQAWRRAG